MDYQAHTLLSSSAQRWPYLIVHFKFNLQSHLKMCIRRGPKDFWEVWSLPKYQLIPCEQICTVLSYILKKKINGKLKINLVADRHTNLFHQPKRPWHLWCRWCTAHHIHTPGEPCRAGSVQDLVPRARSPPLMARPVAALAAGWWRFVLQGGGESDQLRGVPVLPSLLAETGGQDLTGGCPDGAGSGVRSTQEGLCWARSSCSRPGGATAAHPTAPTGTAQLAPSQSGQQKAKERPSQVNTREIPAEQDRLSMPPGG